MIAIENTLLISREDMESIKRNQQEILRKLEKIETNSTTNTNNSSPYLTALEFMKSVSIRRWKFNNLISSGKIRSLKKKRKIYVPKEEVERYFREVNE